MNPFVAGLGGVLVGLVVGLLLARLVFRVGVATRSATSEADLADARSRLDGANQRVEEAKGTLAAREDELARSQREIANLREEQGRLGGQLLAEKQAAEEKAALLLTATDALKNAFQALAAEALQGNNESFLQLAKTKLGEFQVDAKADLESKRLAVEGLVQPVRESLDGVQKVLREVEGARQSAYADLIAQVRAMETGQQRLQAETGNLVKALRAPTVRGRWGEIQLKRVVELAGMLDHCDFCEQEQVTTADGRLRPDLIVKLPAGKNIIVDSKAPLSAYLEALESEDEAVKLEKLKEHARQVRAHMTDLAGKSYWAQFEPTPELVIMFLPGESFFSAALQFDPALIEFGVEQRVIPASPTTLISLLRAVHYGWRQEKLAENAQAISSLGRELYDRLVTWSSYMERVGSGLTTAVTSYNSAVGSLESRVLVTGRKFKDLGTASAKELGGISVVDHVVRELQVEDGLTASVATPGKESSGQAAGIAAEVTGIGDDAP